LPSAVFHLPLSTHAQPFHSFISFQLIPVDHRDHRCNRNATATATATATTTCQPPATSRTTNSTPRQVDRRYRRYRRWLTATVFATPHTPHTVNQSVTHSIVLFVPLVTDRPTNRPTRSYAIRRHGCSRSLSPPLVLFPRPCFPSQSFVLFPLCAFLVELVRCVVRVDLNHVMRPLH